MTEPTEAATLASLGTTTTACLFCDHASHDGTYCLGWTDEDCPESCCPHPCACSYPDPYNYTEVPER